MTDFIQTVFMGMKITDIIDILVVALIVYKLLDFIRETRAEQLVKGLILFGAVFFLSDVLNLNTLNWLIKSITTVGIIALVIVFQPELRRALEYFGRSRTLTLVSVEEQKAKHIIDEFIDAVTELAKTRTGALIVIERGTALTDRIKTGTIIDAEITAQLLGNIFYEGAPLHDGAVIIRGERIHAAGCVLPITDNKTLDKSLGTRHRAGIGITEHSDAISLIVSEETGVISMASEGKITRYLDGKYLEKILNELYLDDVQKSKNIFQKVMGGIKNAGK
ncbi:MAG: diadenylate cyclase CdaA [Clostridiales bacterium]|nr:diadenylate cyclase CdaA [Clostridiales bacterium]MDD6390424.1 diadenylate cyclase CdaA [Bacillota bacterium]MDY5975210.1 diadenylate cyclase CdaA [Anaerovoracaceae bacterium]